jgi:cytochrome c
MDSFELNKILGAILGTLLFVMGVGFLAEAIYEPAKGLGPGYDLPQPAPEPTNPGDTKPVAVADIGTLLATADPKAGEASAKKCQSCHDFTSGGPNKIGPNLYDVVERPIASHPGFAYSDALLKFKGDTWTYAHLNDWLVSPKAMAPGTKMTFAGVPDDKERANIIAYLSTLSASPKPFPAPAAPAASSSAEAPASSSAAAPASSSAEVPASSSAAPASSSEAAPASSSEAAAPSSAASSEAPAASSSSAAQ